MASHKPDQKKLLKTLEEVIKGRQEIYAERSKAFSKSSANASEGKNDEHSWDLKTRAMLEEAFLHFSSALNLNSETDPFLLNPK